MGRADALPPRLTEASGATLPAADVPSGAGDAPATGDARRLQWIATEAMTGNLAGAELELHEWSRQAKCPVHVRLLLALLWARQGRWEDARVRLATIVPDEVAADHAARAMVCLYLLDQMPESSRTAARRLHDAWGHHPAVSVWLNLMNPPGAVDHPPHGTAEVQALAAEVLECFDLVPSLVAAFKVRPGPADVLLLRAALQTLDRHVSDDPDRAQMLCDALADLALATGDHADARRWARRGLALNPYSAHLALILAQLEDEPGAGEPASQALEQALSRHPEYPDLRAALIRRQVGEGHGDDARRLLAQWLERSPLHPLALQLAQEMAA